MGGWFIEWGLFYLFIYFFTKKGRRLSRGSRRHCQMQKHLNALWIFPPFLKSECVECARLHPLTCLSMINLFWKEVLLGWKKKDFGLWCYEKNGPVKNNWSGKCFQLHLSSSVKVPWKTEGKAIRFDHFSNLTIFLLNPLKELWMFSRMFQALQSSTIFNNAITPPALFISSQYFWCMDAGIT